MGDYWLGNWHLILITMSIRSHWVKSWGIQKPIRLLVLNSQYQSTRKWRWPSWMWYSNWIQEYPRKPVECMMTIHLIKLWAIPVYSRMNKLLIEVSQVMDLIYNHRLLWMNQDKYPNPMYNPPGNQGMYLPISLPNLNYNLQLKYPKIRLIWLLKYNLGSNSKNMIWLIRSKSLI